MGVERSVVLAAVEAIREGRVEALKRLLEEDPSLARVHVSEARCPGEARTLLHVATDWPGHFPNGAGTVSVLVAAGADVDAPFIGSHAETPLHWAASSDDVEVIDALLDHGAEIDAPGGVIGGGTPLADAVAFGQWEAARRLVQRGARVGLGEAAALGLLVRVKRASAVGERDGEEIDRAFWMACHGGQRETAEYLLGQGADVNWLPAWERLTPLDAAQRHGFEAVAEWLRSKGGRAAPGRSGTGGGPADPGT